MRWLPMSFVLLALASLPSEAAGHLLLVDLRTDYLPGDEFIQVSTVVRVSATGEGVGLERTTAFHDDDYRSGHRIAEFLDLPDGAYRLFISLRAASGAQIATRQVLLDLRDSRSVTVLLGRPPGGAQKSAELVVDNDGDGAVGVGDRLRYSVALTGALDTFVDGLSADLALVSGSVLSTAGTVADGNGPEDTRVRVVGLAGATAPVVVEFEADVTPRVSNQGSVLLRQSGNTAWLLTDDPSTEEPGDPTSLEISCPVGRWVEDLEACETARSACEEDLSDLSQDLAGCRDERDALEAEVGRLAAQLGAVLADADADEVPAILELCPSTPPGVVVDDRGCSLAQFCTAVDLETAGPAACRGADWLADEPGGNPRDCRVRAATCESES